MTEKLIGKHGASTVVLTQRNVTHEIEQITGGTRKVPAKAGMLEVDLDGDKKVDVRIKSIFSNEGYGYATIDYKGRMVDALNPNQGLAVMLTSASIQHDDNGNLDPQETMKLLNVAKQVAAQDKFEGPSRR